MIKITLDDIQFVESIRDSVKISTKKGDIVAQQKISKMEDKLPGNQFMRVHWSSIVPLNKNKIFLASKH